MTQNMAAGPKTELVGVSSRMQQSIEDMIASLSRGVGDCLENARTAKPENAFDNVRSSERNDATRIVSTTAELLASIAKLKGEFRQSYHVTRVNEVAGDAQAEPKSAAYWKGDDADLLTQEEYDTLSHKEQVDYDRWTNGLPPRFGGWKRPKRETPRHAPRDAVKELSEDVARAERILSATPHPENRGSNDDAGKSQEKRRSARQSQPAEAWKLHAGPDGAACRNARAHPFGAQPHHPHRDDGVRAPGAAGFAEEKDSRGGAENAENRDSSKPLSIRVTRSMHLEAFHGGARCSDAARTSASPRLRVRSFCP